MHLSLKKKCAPGFISLTLLTLLLLIHKYLKILISLWFGNFYYNDLSKYLLAIRAFDFGISLKCPLIKQ